MSKGIQVTLPELIALQAQAKQLRLLKPKQLYTTQAGGYLSKVRGRGIDFEEVRVYQPGDDIRLMDWRVTARTNVPHTKVYHEERERPIYIVVDMGAHMFYGTRCAFKSVVAARLAALLGWSAIQNGDRVGGIIFGGKTSFEYSPKARKQGLLPFLQGLVRAGTMAPEPQTETMLAEALLHLRRVARAGSTLILISDYRHHGQDIEKHLRRLSHKHQLMMFSVLDPIELAPPAAASYGISDGQRLLSLDTRNKKLCAAYQAYFDKQRAYWNNLSAQYRLTIYDITTAESVAEQLAKT